MSSLPVQCTHLVPTMSACYPPPPHPSLTALTSFLLWSVVVCVCVYVCTYDAQWVAIQKTHTVFIIMHVHVQCAHTLVYMYNLAPSTDDIQ